MVAGMAEKKGLFELYGREIEAAQPLMLMWLDPAGREQVQAELNADPQLIEKVRSLREMLGPQLADIEQVLMSHESAKQIRLPTTRKHFARWVYEFAGAHDLDQVYDGEAYFYFVRPEKGLILLYLVTDKREPGITDETMPAVTIRVVEPRPGEIEIITIRQAHDDVARQRYDELLAELDRVYQLKPHNLPNASGDLEAATGGRPDGPTDATVTLMDDIRTLHAEGKSDGQIASKLRKSRAYVCELRGRLGLPANYERGGRKRHISVNVDT